MDAVDRHPGRRGHRALVRGPGAQRRPQRCSIRTTTARSKRPCARGVAAIPGRRDRRPASVATGPGPLRHCWWRCAARPRARRTSIVARWPSCRTWRTSPSRPIPHEDGCSPRLLLRACLPHAIGPHPRARRERRRCRLGLVDVDATLQIHGAQRSTVVASRRTRGAAAGAGSAGGELTALVTDSARTRWCANRALNVADFTAQLVQLSLVHRSPQKARQPSAATPVPYGLRGGGLQIAGRPWSSW